MGGILRNEFGITGKQHRNIKRSIMSDVENVCYVVRGNGDCLECEDIKVFYRDKKQFDIFHNELF